MEAFNKRRQGIQGEYADIVWDLGDIAQPGTDTFHVVDGKIAVQSFAVYMPGQGRAARIIPAHIGSQCERGGRNGRPLLIPALAF